MSETDAKGQEQVAVPEDSGVMLHKKLGPQTICPDLLNNPGPTTRWLYRIAGRVTGTLEGSTQFGKWVALTGEFHALRFDTGETFTSNKAFLPAGAADLIAAALGKMQEADADAAVDLLYDIGIQQNKREKDNPTKYDYVIRKPDGASVKRSQVFDMMKQFALPPGVVKGQPALPGVQ